MKKVLFSLLFVAAAFAANAQSQIEKGRISLGAGGNLGGKFGVSDGNEASAFNLDAKAGYNFMDHLNGGLILNLNNSKSGVADSKATTTWQVGPYVRYYFPVSDVISIYPEAAFLFGDNGAESESSTNEFRIGVGAAYFIGEQISLDFGIHYMSSKVESADKRKADLDIRLGFNLFFGN